MLTGNRFYNPRSRILSSAHRRISAVLFYTYIRILNLVSRRKITGDGSCVLTLTTHGPRITTVFAAIESVARGAVLPKRTILYLDNPEELESLPKTLRRLISRGLEIELSQRNFGPHTKYFPYVTSLRTAKHTDYDLVTADDDILYPRHWLRSLLEARSEDSISASTIFCHRAKQFTFDGYGVAPYVEWPDVNFCRPSSIAFATGVSGVLYPRSFLDSLMSAGDIFLEVCPRADDVWLHYMAIRSGFKVMQITSNPKLFPFVPGTQTGLSLVQANAFGGANDQQIAATYSQDVLTLLASEGT